MSDPDRFARAVSTFEAVHTADPGGRASLYHARVAHHVRALDPAASEAVRLAAHCQHLRRYAVPRSDFPEGKAGYKRWRSSLARMHADESAAILADAGYDPATIDRVRDLLIKKHLRSDPEVQLLENAVCLTFFELDYAALARQHPADKITDILRKTWDKMSAPGHAAALVLLGQLERDGRLPRDLVELVQGAVGG